MSKWIKNTGVKPNVNGRAYEVKLRDGEVWDSSFEKGLNYFNWVIDGDVGDILEWRFVGDKPVEKELTQSEVQQLLHELRDTLSMVTKIKNDYKRCATNLWELSDKDDVLSVGYFEDFSLNRKMYIQYKKREQRLVSLITKLKGLK